MIVNDVVLKLMSAPGALKVEVLYLQVTPFISLS